MDEHFHPLREIRDAAKLTQEAMAERLGSLRTYIAQVEGGHSEVGKDFGLKCLEEFHKEMDSLGISLEELLRGERAPEPEEDEHGVVRRARK